MKDHEISFLLLRSALEGGKPELKGEVPTSQWWSVFKLLQRSHVAALAGRVISNIDMPREVKMPWITECAKAADWYRHQSEVQNEIIDVMQKHGIKTMVLKGTHIAQYYPVPDVREFGDLDLYFFDKHKEADAVAEKELNVDINNEAHHHSKYAYRGVTVESHYDFINSHYPPSNRRYEAMLKKLSSQDATRSTFEILFLLRHMAGHFATSRITLRDLIDWHLTCSALKATIDWNLVQKVVKKYGMEQFTAAINILTNRHFGSDIPLNLTVDNKTVNKIANDIIYGSPESVDNNDDGFSRLGWKLRRWRSMSWKRQLVYSDSGLTLLLSSIGSHAEKPYSIMHKQ